MMLLMKMVLLVQVKVLLVQVVQMLCVNFWLDLMMMLPLVLNFYESVVLVLVFSPPSLSYYSPEFLFWGYRNYSGSH